MFGQIGLRVIEAAAINFGFEVEIERRLLFGDDVRERRLAGLPCAEQDESSLAGQGVAQNGQESAFNHPRKLPASR